MMLGIFGRRESGKSVLARAVTEEMAKSNQLCFVYDPTDSWSDENETTIEEIKASNELRYLNVLRGEDPDEIITLAQRVTNCTYVHDEIDLLCTPNSWKSETAKNVARRGRHKRFGRVAFIYTGQRFANCHGDLISLATKICVFETTGKNDLKRIGDELGDEYVAAIARLQPFEFVCWPDKMIGKVGLNGEAAFQETIATRLAKVPDTPEIVAAE